MIKLAFDVPYPYFPEFTDLMDFYVVHWSAAAVDVKLREKVKPVGLLLADEMPLTELRRAVSLCVPHHVTVHPPRDPKAAVAFLAECNTAFDAELAVVVPPGADALYSLACSEDVSVVYLPWWEERAIWLVEQDREASWLHFGEIGSAAELKDLVGLRLRHASLHTAKPVKMAYYDCDWLGANQLPDLEAHQRLTREQVAKARELMVAMREVCA